VIFTFIRDGIPLYDRGAFMPWKLLLKMGKIKPSPEAIDLFMSMGDKLKENVKRKLLDIVVGDIYWSTLTPSQALIMLYGMAPPTPKETAEIMRKIFVEKEKMLEKKYVDILERVVKIYKDYEHDKIKEIKGEEIDKLMLDVESYLKRLKELREQIERRAQEKTIEQIYDETLTLLKEMFGRRSEQELVERFDKELVRKGLMSKKMLTILKDIIKARKEFKKGKLAKHEVENARKNASLLINALIEYNQRKELASRTRFIVRFMKDDKTQEAELVVGKNAYVIMGGKIYKIGNKLQETSQEDLDKARNEHGKLTTKILETLRKELGEFEIEQAPI